MDEGFQARTSSWKVGRVIGKGGSSVVRIATAKDDENHQVAMKIIDLKFMGKPFAEEHLIHNEAQILSVLDHPNIIQLEYSFLEDNHLISCMEYIDGNDLSSYVTRYAPDIKEIQQLFYQLCVAVSYCHSQMVVHGDLKCENVLIRKHDRSVKVIDFGYSRQFESKDEELQILGQTIEYSPPRDQHLSFVWDSWSLGVILYVMITHCLPFTTFKLVDEIQLLETAERAKKVTKEQIFEVLVSLWVLDPRHRPLIGDLMNKSPWLKEMAPQQKRKEEPSSISSLSSAPFSCVSFSCISSPLSSFEIPFGSRTPNSFTLQNLSISFPETSSSPRSFILFDSSGSSTPLRERRSLKIKRDSTQTRESIRTDSPESIRIEPREPTRNNVQEQGFPSPPQKEGKKTRGKKGSIIPKNKFFF